MLLLEHIQISSDGGGGDTELLGGGIHINGLSFL
jgi:hypothetical protein